MVAHLHVCNVAAVGAHEDSVVLGHMGSKVVVHQNARAFSVALRLGPTQRAYNEFLSVCIVHVVF